MMPTPALPNACGAGLNAAKASVLNHRSIVRCELGSSGSPTKFGRARRSPPRFSTVDPPSVAVSARPLCSTWRPLSCQPPSRRAAAHLPATRQQIGRPAPIVAEPATAAEGEFPDVASDEAVLDVELGGAAIGREVVAVLRLAERAGVDAGAAAARRN